MRVELYTPEAVRRLPEINDGLLLHCVLNVLEHDVANRCPATPQALAENGTRLAILKESNQERLFQILIRFPDTFLRIFPRKDGVERAVVFALPECEDLDALEKTRFRLYQERYFDLDLVMGIFEMKFDVLVRSTVMPFKVFVMVVRHLSELDAALKIKQEGGIVWTDPFWVRYHRLYPPKV